MKGSTPWPSGPEKPKQVSKPLEGGTGLPVQAGFSSDDFPSLEYSNQNPGPGLGSSTEKSVQRPCDLHTLLGGRPAMAVSHSPPSSPTLGHHAQASGQGPLRAQGQGLCSICWPGGGHCGPAREHSLSLRPPWSPSDPRTWPAWPGRGHWVVCLSKGLPAVISDAQCSGNVNRSIWLTYQGLAASLSKQAVSWFTHR